ncbi:MAG: CheR family methyltransferase [Solirubrobacteraceae bacterium]
MSVLTGDDYTAFCGSLRELCGIDLAQYKRPQMERRLRAFFERKGITRLTDSIAELRRDPAQLDALLDRITINVSQLWRNPEQWSLLESRILPELSAAGVRELRAWSAGCSYGAEAYTLAAICHLAHLRPRVSILGTDIDKRMVARAQSAMFSDEDTRTAPQQQLRSTFEKVDDGWRARPPLREMTRFETGDLLKISPRPGSFDLILCRNTVIYFSEPIRDALHVRLASGLRSGGYLVVGSTERVADAAALGLKMSHPFIYRKA